MKQGMFGMVVGVVALTTGTLCVIAACGNSTTQSQPSRASRKGEACQTTNDCGGGLSCIPTPTGSGGVCVTGEFNIAKTAKKCDIIQCAVADDCCNSIYPQATCDMYKAQCGDGGLGTFACQQYNQYCKCDTTKLTCENGHCQTHCNTDPDCNNGSPNGSLKCSGGKCVQCTDDAQCPNGDYCDNGSCQPPCQTDGDCPSFNRCVSTRCVSGTCQTDRECVAATHNVQATCRTDGTCVVPCQTDLECGSPMNYSFYSCLSGYCQYTGCENDKECALYFSGGSDASVNFGTHAHVVCRDVPTSTQ